MTKPAKKNEILSINKDLCKECGLCIAACPRNALELSEEFNAKGFHPVRLKSGCNYCGMCYLVCPDYVIEIKDHE